MKNIFTLMIMLLLICSCAKQFDEQGFLNEKLEGKIDKFLLDKQKECIDKAAKEAAFSVDSVMVSIWSEINKFDSLEFPDRPLKPNRPEGIIDLWEDPKDKRKLDSIK